MRGRDVKLEQYPEFKRILTAMLDDIEAIIGDDTINDKECRIANILNNSFK
jgi:hypothetical protein